MFTSSVASNMGIAFVIRLLSAFASRWPSSSSSFVASARSSSMEPATLHQWTCLRAGLLSR